MFQFDNSYLNLHKSLFDKSIPTPVAFPSIAFFNYNLASELRIDFKNVELAEILCGNNLLNGSEPIAQAYAGHQFGQFTILGDGRAILLGEHVFDNAQNRVDIQLKGAGKTIYSRRGDGRASLYAMLREYLISEGMHGLKIASSRSLAVVDTGETIAREELLAGAVLTRVMPSHIRVGSFEFASRQSIEILKEYADYVINRHFEELNSAENKYLNFLKKVVESQINLIINWKRVGFIHGVMNTDNMSICACTFDYGPCAFMNTYDPETVFSSIDTNRRYSFGNQEKAARWNLAVLASSLLPLLHENEKIALELAQEVIDSFEVEFQVKDKEMYAKKLGFLERNEKIDEFVDSLLSWMYQSSADYTNTFLAFESEEIRKENSVFQGAQFQQILNNWLLLLKVNSRKQLDAWNQMKEINPWVIPRNHLVEEALASFALENNKSLFEELLTKIQQPYSNRSFTKKFNGINENIDEGYFTFCGT